MAVELALIGGGYGIGVIVRRRALEPDPAQTATKARGLNRNCHRNLHHAPLLLDDESVRHLCQVLASRAAR